MENKNYFCKKHQAVKQINKLNILLFSFIIYGFTNNMLTAQNKRVPADICINVNEHLLAEKINNLRKQYGKRAIPLSKSLTYVAKLHVEDLQKNHPDTSICNLSSWSDKGKWTPCCYNKYVVNHDCMWKKPKELTGYIYRGYEMAAYFQDGVSTDSLEYVWFDSRKVLDFILTQGDWSQKSWRAMGVAMSGNYVSVWFGQRADKAGKPALCKETVNQTIKPKTVTGNNKTKGYYLIFGSYNKMKDAKSAVRRVKAEGFKHAGVITKNNHFRLYLSKFDTLKEAMAAKQKLPTQFKDAWILKL